MAIQGLSHLPFWHRGVRISFLSFPLMNLVCQWLSFHSGIGPSRVSFISLRLLSSTLGVLVCSELGELLPTEDLGSSYEEVPALVLQLDLRTSVFLEVHNYNIGYITLLDLILRGS